MVGFCAPITPALILMNNSSENLKNVLISLRRIIRATDLHSKRMEKSTGLTIPQILILRSIHQQAGLTISYIAQEVNLSQATVTTILDRLEQRQYIYRERSVADKRKTHVYLTEAGQAAMLGAPAPLQEHFSAQFNNLADWEQNTILSTLQRIAHMMNAENIEASPILDVGDIDRLSINKKTSTP